MFKKIIIFTFFFWTGTTKKIIYKTYFLYVFHYGAQTLLYFTIIFVLLSIIFLVFTELNLYTVLFLRFKNKGQK